MCLERSVVVGICVLDCNGGRRRFVDVPSAFNPADFDLSSVCAKFGFSTFLTFLLSALVLSTPFPSVCNELVEELIGTKLFFFKVLDKIGWLFSVIVVNCLAERDVYKIGLSLFAICNRELSFKRASC